jgi:hypothetical protein
VCMNCGCMEPDNTHDDPANITLEQLRRAGEANGQDLDQTIDNIERTYHQSVEGTEGGRSRHEHAF